MSNENEQAPASESAAETIRREAWKVRQSQHDGEGFRVELEESRTSMRRAARGPSFWEKARPKLLAALLTALGGLAGTGGGVAYQKTQPPPSVVEVRKLREQLETLQEKQRALEEAWKEARKSDNDDRKEAIKDLRSLMFEQINPITSRVNSLEGWQTEQIRQQRR